jgi:hypothetical protein
LLGAALAGPGERGSRVLIFLAGVAFLLMLLALGERAATQLWHGGANRYFDYCSTCDVRFPRPAGIARLICPHGHVMSAVIVEPHTPRTRGIAFIAVCAGFIVVALLLTVTGLVPAR